MTKNGIFDKLLSGFFNDTTLPLFYCSIDSSCLQQCSKSAAVQSVIIFQLERMCIKSWNPNPFKKSKKRSLRPFKSFSTKFQQESLCKTIPTKFLQEKVPKKWRLENFRPKRNANNFAYSRIKNVSGKNFFVFFKIW